MMVLLAIWTHCSSFIHDFVSTKLREFIKSAVNRTYLIVALTIPILVFVS